jgi:hypothetical protein
LVLDKARLSDPNGNIIGGLSTTQLNRLILEAMEEVTIRTNMPEIFARTTWPNTNPATQEVTLPPDVNKLLRVYLNGKEVQPTTIWDLNDEPQLVFDADWQVLLADSTNSALSLGNSVPISNSNGVEFQYYIRKQQPLRLGMVPAVNAAISLVIDYVQLPSLPNSTSVPLNYPHDFQTIIVDETLWRVMRMLRRHDEANAIQADADKHMTRTTKSIMNAQSQYINHMTPYPYNDHFRF